MSAGFAARAVLPAHPGFPQLLFVFANPGQTGLVSGVLLKQEVVLHGQVVSLTPNPFLGGLVDCL